MNANIYESYVPQFSKVRELTSTMPSSLRSKEFIQEENFEKYLCAIAYASLGKQILSNTTIPVELLKNNAFAQGLMTATILELITFVKQKTENLTFEKNKTLDIKNFSSVEDNAKLIFIVYYLRTQGYKIQWNRNQSKNFDPMFLNTKDSLTFEQTTKVNAKQCMDNMFECVVMPVLNI